MSVSLNARKDGIAPNQLFSWKQAMENGALTAVGSEGSVVPESETEKLEDRIKRLKRLLERKTEEVDILKEIIRIGYKKTDSARAIARGARFRVKRMSAPHKPAYGPYSCLIVSCPHHPKLVITKQSLLQKC
jgi:transposase-like protein